MTQLSATTRIGSDERYELAASAAASERRARPTHLVVLGALALMVTMIATGLGWRASANAERDLARLQRDAASISSLVAQIESLEAAAAEQSGDDPYTPIPDLLSRLSQLAEQVGLEYPLALPKNQEPQTRGSSRLLIYPYTIRDSSLSRVLEWIDQALTRVPGLRVRALKLTPSARNWVVEVTLARYERAG
jgi:hypothetical protein